VPHRRFARPDGAVRCVVGRDSRPDSFGEALVRGSSSDVSAITGIGEFVFALWLVIWAGFMLAEHIRRFPPGADELIFTTADDRPVRRQRISAAWRKAADAAGLPEKTGFHATRHFYASLLIQHGESVKVVQARLGHASAIETLDTYGHLWPDSEDATREAVDLVLADSAGRPRDAVAAEG
jgi:hypothetical protein